MGALTGIEHVVVLMLENRSFDCMFGQLYKGRADFDGLSGTETIPYRRPDGTTANLPVWNNVDMVPETATIPDPDPGELFGDINTQLFGGDGTPTSGPPPMSGFAQNYMAQPAADQPADPMSVLHYFTPKQVPVISQLATAFGVSDRWFASAPCQTWPNRFFVHSATCAGHVNNKNFSVPYDKPTIFGRMRDKGKSWRIYYHDIPQTATLSDIWLEAVTHFRHFDDFLADAKSGALPNYSFIEPRYFTDLAGFFIPNDEHPPHNVVYGEQLIADVYNAVRASPTWKKTLLIITYDEHGGIYDHVPPPAAVPPDALRPDGFAFDRYGVRVPAVIISPYMPPGSVVRPVPTPLPQQGPPYPFDHTSIIKTLRTLFNLGPALTARDDAAPDLLGALSLINPENDGPASVARPAVEADPVEVAKRAAAPPNDMQKNLCRMATNLPVPGAGPAPPAATDTVEATRSCAVAGIKSFLNKSAN